MATSLLVIHLIYEKGGKDTIFDRALCGKTELVISFDCANVLRHRAPGRSLGRHQTSSCSNSSLSSALSKHCRTPSRIIFTRRSSAVRWGSQTTGAMGSLDMESRKACDSFTFPLWNLEFKTIY